MRRYFGWNEAVTKFHTEQTDKLISDAELDYLK